MMLVESEIQKSRIIKMSVLSKLLYRINKTSIQIPTVLFLEIRRLILKLYGRQMTKNKKFLEKTKKYEA